MDDFPELVSPKSRAAVLLLLDTFEVLLNIITKMDLGIIFCKTAPPAAAAAEEDAEEENLLFLPPR